MSDNRSYRRQRTLKGGRIVFNQRSSVFDCSIRNLSQTGACLNVPSTIGIPEFFELILEPESTGRSCQVMWRSDRRIGVRFLATDDAALEDSS
jgi:hypothetical protein